MEQFIKHLIKNNYSKNTIITYKNILNNYINIWTDIRNIKKRILSYQDSPNTIWTHYNVICSYMKFISDKIIKKIKELKLPSIANRYMPIFSKTYLSNKTKDLSIYKNVIIRFLFETGLRACKLKQIISIKNNTLLLKVRVLKLEKYFTIIKPLPYLKALNLLKKH